MQRRFWYGLLVMAVGYLLFVSGLIGGAPVDSGDDYQHIAIAAEASWLDAFNDQCLPHTARECVIGTPLSRDFIG